MVAYDRIPTNPLSLGMGRPIKFTSGAPGTQHFDQINEDMYQLDLCLGIRAIPPPAGCREFHARPPGRGAALSAVSQSTYAQNAQCPDHAQEWAQIGPNLGRRQRQTAQHRCSTLAIPDRRAPDRRPSARSRPPALLAILSLGNDRRRRNTDEIHEHMPWTTVRALQPDGDGGTARWDNEEMKKRIKMGHPTAAVHRGLLRRRQGERGRRGCGVLAAAGETSGVALGTTREVREKKGWRCRSVLWIGENETPNMDCGIQEKCRMLS
jgi:hypothetical protein